MTTLGEVLVLIAMIVCVFGGLALTYLWVCAAAKWLWQLTIRRWLVIAVTLAVLLVIVVPLHLLTGLDMVTSLGFLIGLTATPIIAVPLADAVAWSLSPQARRDSAPWRNFIFADKRRAQSDEYSAPSSDPIS